MNVKTVSYRKTRLSNIGALIILKLFVLLLLFPFAGLSQDASFSQFTTNNLYFNPAYVGSNEKIDVLIHYRRYLTRMPSKFENMYFSVDFPFNFGKNFGLGGAGILFFQDSEGDGSLKKSLIGMPISTQISSNDQRYLVQFGIMPSIVFNSVNWTDYIFGNQLDKNTGYDKNIQPPTGNYKEKLPAYPDFSFGFLGKYVTVPNMNSDFNSKVLEIGVAFHHLPLKINQSFSNGFAPLPFKLVGVVKYTFPIEMHFQEDLLIQPAAVFELQGPMSTSMISAKIIKPMYLFGFGFRNEQTDILAFNNFFVEMGFSILDPHEKQRRSWITLSIDLPVKSQYTVVNTSWELSINFKLPQKWFRGICPNDRCKTVNYDKKSVCRIF